MPQILKLCLPKCFLESYFSWGHVSSKNAKSLWGYCLGRATEVHLSFEDEEPRGTEHNMTRAWYQTQGNFEWIVALVSYLFHYGTLLQNATDIITKCDSYFITVMKCDRMRQGACYKIRPFYYWQLLENASILLKNDCD